MSNALIIVDVQNDFISGSLAVPGGEDVARKIHELVRDQRGPGKTYDYVVTTQDWHIDPGDHWSETPDYKDSWPVHCKVGTAGAELFPELTFLPFDARFRKGHHSAAYSGFEGINAMPPLGDGLENWLVRHDVTEVDVVGLALDYCVKATALDAKRLGFHTRVLTHLTAPVSIVGGNVAILELLDADVTLLDAFS